MTIGKKIYTIGVIILVSLIILALNNYIFNKKAIESSRAAAEMRAQYELIEHMSDAHGQLMLAAMDTLVDKDSGRIESSRKQTIDNNSTFLKDKTAALNKIADTAEKKQAASQISAAITKLTDSLQKDLPRLIQGHASDSELATLDDALDNQGDRIRDGLQRLAQLVDKEMDATTESSIVDAKFSQTIGGIVFFVTFIFSLVTFVLLSRSIMQQLSALVKKLKSGAEQVALSSSQMAEASTALAEGASEQAASLEETSATIEEITSMTKRNAENASQADSLMQETNKVVVEANESMVELTQAMEEISNASLDTQNIVKTIDEIAFQTNLLALNAAVEAARAGEAGAGFAVVADEVRNLAMRAAEAARNTGELIEGTLEKVNGGSSLVGKTNDAFSRVAENASNVTALVNEIAIASNEQSNGITQISRAVSEMDQVTQRNAATAEQSSSVSEELRVEGGNFKTLINQLASMIGYVEEGLRTGAASIAKSVEKVKTKKPKKASKTAPKRPQKSKKQIYLPPVSSETKTPPKKKTPPKPVEKKPQELKPEDIIPFDDDDDNFEDF